MEGTVTSRHRIIVAPPVRELLTAEDLDTLMRSAATGYRCLTCGEDDELAAGPVSVVVRLAAMPGAGPDGPQAAHVRLAHERCSPSRVIQDPGTYQVPGEARMTARAAILPHPRGRRALLITEALVQMSAVTAGGDWVDPIIAGLLGQGLHLLAGVGERPAAAPGWSVRLPSTGEPEVLDPTGELFYGGELYQPPEWRRLVAKRGTVELITGVVGIAPASMDPAEGIRVLADAARRGRLIGATICVRDRA